MGKTRDLFKKIRDTKGTFHAKLGMIKDRNGMDLTEAEDIKKRWQEYTEELYNEYLNDPDSHDGVVTHLEPNILECEVKWALASLLKARRGNGIPGILKASKGDEIPGILQMMLRKCCTQYASKFGKLSSGLGTGQGQFSFQSLKKAMPKNVQTTARLYSFHMLAK